MSADFHPTVVRVAAPSANTILTATLCSVANYATADAAAMATDSVRWRNVSRSACSVQKLRHLAT